MNYLPIRRLFITSAVFALGFLFLLVGCALNPAPPPTPTPPPPTATPLPRGGNLTVRLAADIPDLRPWQPRSRGEEQVMSLLYSGLVRLDAKLQPQPDIATHWDASQDGRLITFTLRPDVVWHDGKPLTSSDVAYTLNALHEISPTTALLVNLRRIAEITTPTTSTLVISLTERYAPIFSQLTVPILPKHVLEGQNIATLNFWDVPIGSGPFQFGSRQAGTSITLNANKAFYRGQPLLDRVAFLVAPDPRVAAQALKDQRLLFAEWPEWNTAKTISQTVSNVRTGFYPENGYYFLGFNTREGRPFADVRVRQALAQTIDLPKLVQAATDGQGIPIADSAVPGSWADFVKPATATISLERAGALLDEAGWKVPAGGGIRQRQNTPLTAQLFVRGDDPRRVRAAELIAKTAQTLGISVTVQPSDFASVIQPKYAPPYNFDLLLGSWSNGAGDPTFSDYMFYDPDDFLLFHSSQINQGVEDTRPALNFVGFSDSVYDNRSVAAQQLYDLDQRGNALRLSQERIDEEKPYFFLWDDRILVSLSTRVTTLDGPVDLSTPMYFGNVERWYLTSR